MRKTAKRVYGWMPDLPDARDRVFSAAPRIAAALPAGVDLRPQCPPVYNQGQLGSCSANAIAGAHQFDQIKQARQAGNNGFVPSRLFIYYNERAIEGTVNSDSGATLRDGIKTIVRQGVCPETQWPYIIGKFTAKPTPTCYAAALKSQGLLYRNVVQSREQIRGALASGYPVAFGFSVYETFESETVTNTGVVPMPRPGESLLGGHAVMAVGYDDNNRWFIVRNSWAATWGDKGYCYMPYAYVTNPLLAGSFWVLSEVEIPGSKG